MPVRSERMESPGTYGMERWRALELVQEFRYLGHIMTADCRDDKDIKKTINEAKCCWEYAGQEFLISPIEAKIQLFKSYCYPIYGCALWHNSYQNSIRKLNYCQF